LFGMPKEKCAGDSVPWNLNAGGLPPCEALSIPLLSLYLISRAPPF